MLSSMNDPSEPHMLVLGGSGAVGRYLLRRTNTARQAVLAWSRRAPPAWALPWTRVHWRRGDLHDAALDTSPGVGLILSAGPLDALAAACARGLPAGLRRVVALSSLSLWWKDVSPNPAEQRLARAIVAAEQALTELLVPRGVELVLLRVGLIYGAGIDHSLTPLLRFAQRWRVLPWPRRAQGLRRPVHADDLAAALLVAAQRPELAGATLQLPGPQALPFDQLLDRLLAALAPGARRLPVPLPVPQRLLQWCATGERRTAALAAVVLRAACDQVVHPDDWTRLGLVPRGFEPTAADFCAW
jgi:nucleoside-diphosphate-sugar epimerase